MRRRHRVGATLRDPQIEHLHQVDVLGDRVPGDLIVRVGHGDGRSRVTPIHPHADLVGRTQIGVEPTIACLPLTHDYRIQRWQADIEVGEHRHPGPRLSDTRHRGGQFQYPLDRHVGHRDAGVEGYLRGPRHLGE